MANESSKISQMIQWLESTSALLLETDTPVSVSHQLVGEVDMFVIKSRSPQFLVGKHGVTLGAMQTLAQKLGHKGVVRLEIVREGNA